MTLLFVLFGLVGLPIACTVLLVLVSMFAGSRDERQAEREKDRGFRVKARLRITYRDRNDAVTTRDIEALKYLDCSPGEIYAYCRLRRANRTFFTSRVQQAIDLETGEIIKRLPTYFRARRAPE